MLTLPANTLAYLSEAFVAMKNDGSTFTLGDNVLKFVLFVTGLCINTLAYLSEVSV